MNIFILGCGFVGSHLADYLKQKGNLVTVTTTSISKIKKLESISNQVVLLDENTSLKKLLTHQDVLIVCAAPKTSKEYEKVYLQIALNLEEALIENTHIKQLIYTSSCSVYGEKKGEWVDENHVLEPANLNQQILVDAEKVYLNKLPRSIKTCLFRLGEIYGLDKAIEKRIEKLSGSSLTTHPENFTNLIHVRDVIRAISWAIHHKANGVFNLCNDSHLTRREFYDKWCQFLKLKPVEFGPFEKNAHRGNKRVSNQKIKLMGFEFEHPCTDPTSV